MSTAYQILSADSAAILEDRVTEALRDGWQLQGGVSIASHDGELVFAQAMIKVVSEERAMEEQG